MILVPALDLKGGNVVHARSGRRENYLPIESRLFRGSDPGMAAEALLNLHPFPALYVADLDRIEGVGANDAGLRAIWAANPAVELWVDGGFRSGAEILALRAVLPVVPVVGSESLGGGNADAVLEAAGPDCILSLDFRGGRFLGPRALLDDPSRWPWRVIVMELERVGAGQGPNLERLAVVAASAARAGAGTQIFAAGGVRNLADLRRLRAAGIAGALIATALHTGTLTKGDLESLAADAGRAGFEA